MEKERINYNVGLDIGTNSVGWSVVDENYNLLKKNGKNMWGSRLFDSGETAESRRLSRNTRRRYNRRRNRINYFKDIFGKDVLTVDEQFFMRLEKGFLYEEDRGYHFNLFNDGGFDDKDYYKKFPTIYHLRKHLIESKEKEDPRLIYLAIHHILKYRGNFINEGEKFDINNMETTITNLVDFYNEIIHINNFEESFGKDECQLILNNLLDDSKKKKEKETIINNLIKKEDQDFNKLYKQITKLLLGYKVSADSLFIDSSDGYSEIKIEFNSDNLEEILSNLNDEEIEIINKAYSVYSFMLLKNILKENSESISEAMINIFNNYKQDLNLLKKALKATTEEETIKDFLNNSESKGSYASYINKPKETTIEELYKKIVKIFDKKENNKDVKAILEKIELESFLLKQTSKDNGAIPYQLHLYELEKIIDNQSKYYQSLKDNKDKLIKILTFRIPYYIGPLDKNSKFSWIVRKNEGNIRPWNFEETVNTIESAEAFIRRMTNKCSYLINEEVLPKKSLLYSKYEVLNELNKVKIDDKPLSVESKQKIFNELFMKNNKITSKKLVDFMFKEQMINDKNVKVKGMQKEDEFATSLEPYNFYKKVLGDEFNNLYEEIEQIIEWQTVYEDKKILKRRIKETYSDIFSDEIIKILANKRFTGWGRLSKKLLVEPVYSRKYEARLSIMDVLYKTNLNFMQIINDKEYGFKQMIEDYNDKLYKSLDLSHDDVDNLQGSPAIKKGVWQSICIVKEIAKIMKKDPENIFIEFAREDQEKKRTSSRYKQLLKKYEELEKDNNIKSIINELKENQKSLEDEKVYLYFIQNGKCMYTQEELKLSNLSNYEVDHIIPRSYIKDNSFENKVLVTKSANQVKGDRLFLDDAVIQKNRSWWLHLLKTKMIGEKKYKNLIRNKINDVETVGFINRQLVETRQITKHVANLLQSKYETTNIVSIKAGLNSSFRDKFGLYKIRDLNDYHHAQDAYITTIIGTFVLKKYPVLKNEFIFDKYLDKNKFKDDLNKSSKNKYEFIIDQLGSDEIQIEKTGEIIWAGNADIEKIKKAFYYKDCFITKKLEEKNGQLFDLTVLPKEKWQESSAFAIPVNKNRKDVTKYGGMGSTKNSYMVAIEYSNKNKIKRTIENVPIMFKDSPTDLNKYLEFITNSKDIKIIRKILINQKVKIEDSIYYLSSAHEIVNAKQLLLNNNEVNLLNKILNESASDEEINKFYDIYCLKFEKQYHGYVSIYEKLEKSKEGFYNLEKNKKIDSIKQLLIITKANPSNGNINEKGFSIGNRIGRKSNINIDLDKIELIEESITGMYSKVTKL